MMTYRRGQHQFNTIKGRQEILKRELRSAKDRLCIPNHKWSYECELINIRKYSTWIDSVIV